MYTEQNDDIYDNNDNIHNRMIDYKKFPKLAKDNNWDIFEKINVNKKVDKKNSFKERSYKNHKNNKQKS